MHAVYRNGKYEVKSSLFHSSCSSRQEVSARRIVVKRQVTVATLMVSSTVMLSSCVADIGTRSASEETTKVDEAGGISSADGAGGTNGGQGDDAEGNQGETAHTNGEKNAGGAGQPGEAGATGSGDTSGVLPPLGEFDPADPSFELFDPCTEIPKGTLQEIGAGELEGDTIRETGLSLCTFALEGSDEFPGIIGFSSSKRTPTANQLLELENSQLEVETSPVEFVEDELFEDMFCTAGVQTRRGYVTVSHSGRSFDSNFQEKCFEAEKILLQLS